jgi:CheY-like chemotaxis protein
VSETLGVVEQGDYYRCHAEYSYLVCSGHRPWQRNLLRILQRKHPKDLVRLERVDHRLRARRHGQSGDFHDLRRIVIDRQRDPVVSRQVRRLLALQTAEEVESNAFVHVTDSCRLRPTIRSQRAEAVEILTVRRDVKIVISDVRMPGPIDGVELSRRVRSHYPGIKVVLSSGEPNAADSTAHDGFFLKPYRVARIIRHIRSFTD